jgi:hypothetical protein
LSVIVRLAVRVPEAKGVKVMLIVHFAPAATELPQVLVWAKSPAFVPAIAMLLVMLRVELPGLLSVTVPEALGVPMLGLEKLRLVGERLA